MTSFAQKLTRRSLLKGAGGLVVAFSVTRGFGPAAAQATGTLKSVAEGAVDSSLSIARMASSLSIVVRSTMAPVCVLASPRWSQRSLRCRWTGSA